MKDYIFLPILAFFILISLIVVWKIVKKIFLLLKTILFSLKNEESYLSGNKNTSPYNKNNKKDIFLKSYKNCVTKELLEEEARKQKEPRKFRIFLANPIGFFTQLIFNEKAHLLNAMMESEEYHPDKHFQFLVKAQNSLKHKVGMDSDFER